MQLKSDWNYIGFNALKGIGWHYPHQITMTKPTPKQEKKLLAKLDEYIPDTPWKPTLIAHFKNDSTFLKPRVMALKLLLKLDIKEIVQVFKTTRATSTYSKLFAALDLGIPITLVENNNKIITDTFEDIKKIYMDQTGRTDFFLRQINSNERSCTEVEIPKKRKGIHIPTRTPECDKCEGKAYIPKPDDILTPEHIPIILPEGDGKFCSTKTMMKEDEYFRDMGKDYIPDIIGLTYHKLRTLNSTTEKNVFFQKLIGKSQIILFDEFGAFLQQTAPTAMIHEVARKRKSDGGAVIEGSEDDIRMIYHNLLKFIQENENEINQGIDRVQHGQAVTNVGGIQHVKRIAHVLEKYVRHIRDDYEAIMNCERPSNYINPLGKFMESIKKGNEVIIVPRNEELGYNIEEYIDAIDHLRINETGIQYAEFLYTFLNVIQNGDLSIKYTKGREYSYKVNGNEKNVYALRTAITQSTRFTLRTLAEHAENYSHQNIILSDATLGKIDISNLGNRFGLSESANRKHVRENWGDPLKTNNEQMFFQFIPSSESWKRNPEFREFFVEQVYDVISALSKIEGCKPLIVVSKKKIAKYFIANSNGKIVCANKNLKEDQIPITYYNSSLSRGVNSDTNLSIQLGSALKPNEAFDVAILGNLSLFLPSYIDDAGLKKFADDQGMTLKEFKDKIEVFSYPESIPKNKTKKPTEAYTIKVDVGDNQPSTPPITSSVPPELRPLFDFVVKQHQKRITAQDTKQCVDRSKGATGSNRNAVIQLCVPAENSKAVVNLGADVITDFSQIKRSKSKKFKINPPHHKTVHSFDDLIGWMNGEDIPSEESGYHKDLVWKLYQNLKHRHGASINCSEILANYGGGINVDHSTDGKIDGFLPAVLNIKETEIKSHGMNIKKTGNQHKMKYEISLNNDLDLSIIDIVNAEITSVIGDNAIMILHDAAKRDGKMYSWRTASRNNLLLTKGAFNQAFGFMEENGFFNGSEWTVGINSKNNKAIFKS